MQIHCYHWARKLRLSQNVEFHHEVDLRMSEQIKQTLRC